MEQRLSVDEWTQYQGFAEFTRKHFADSAHLWERSQSLPPSIIHACAEAGYLGATLPSTYGGRGWSNLTYGLLNEAIGAVSVSLTGLLNVHTMVSRSLLRWGSDEQQARWLPAMARGETLAAFALTEPQAGSDIDGISTEFVQDGDDLLITGTKKWITFGECADLYLVFGKLSGAPTAALVERGTPDLTVTPIRGMIGFRASHLGQLDLHECRIPRANLLGRPGTALAFIAPYALDYGRLSVAFAALGMLRASLEICGKHVSRRTAFGKRLIEHSSIAELLTDLGVDHEASQLLCLESARLKDDRSPEATEAILTAKYFTSRAAARHASNAIQMLGALGCHDETPLSRFLGDAKVMEIIEGSNQIHQALLGGRFAARQRVSRTPRTA